MIAFGYAITSVAVESGAQARVSGTPSGCIVPKWLRAIGVLTRNVAMAAANAREANSPRIPVSGLNPRHTSSVGIQANHRKRTVGARCRSAMTQAKLSWKPALVATDGSATSMTIAAIAIIELPCQSRPDAAPVAPTMAISAERVALAAGAMMKSAHSAASATGIARSRGLVTKNEVIRATTQPSTARLKPEIARMCASPTERNAFSIGA